MVQLKELKEKCEKNESIENPEKVEMMKQLGFQDIDNPDFVLEQKQVGWNEKWGSKYADGGFCLTQKLTFPYGDSRFDKILNTFKSQQDKTSNTWKYMDGGLGYDKGTKSWCSTNPNSVIPMIEKLKEKGFSVGEHVKSCDLLNGVPKKYLKLNIDTYDSSLPQPIITKEKEKKEIVPKIDEPKKEIPKDASRITINLKDKSSDIFIPFESLTGDNYAKLQQAIDTDIGEDQLVSYEVERYDQELGKKVKDKYKLLKKGYKNGIIGFIAPIGLTGNIQKLIQNQLGIRVDINDQRSEHNSHPFELQSPYKLRDYQQKVADQAIKQKGGIIEMATGSGKTMTMTDIIGKIGQDTAFIVPNNSLFFNAKTQIEQYVDTNKVNIGQVGGMKIDRKSDPDKVNINIVSLPLAYMAFDTDGKERIDPTKKVEIEKVLQQSNVIVFDEVHHLAADKYKLVSAHSPAKYRYGLSATPKRDDHRDLEIVGGVGENIGKISAKMLIDKGFLTPPEIVMVNNDDVIPKTEYEIIDNLKDSNCEINKQTKMYKKIKEDPESKLPPSYDPTYFRYVEKSAIECNPKRNDRIIDVTKKLEEYGKTKVVFVKSVEHAKKLQKQMEDEGIYSEILVGEEEANIVLTPKERQDPMSLFKKRNALFERMKDGSLKTIIATDKIMGEGVDIPNIDTLILTGMRKSTTDAIQIVGRALRLKKDKKTAFIVDFYDDLPYLRDWNGQRQEVWKDQEFPIKHITYDQFNPKLTEIFGEKTVNLENKLENDAKLIQEKNIRKQYGNMLLPDLKRTAKEKGIKKISTLKKSELIELLSDYDLK